MLLTMNHTHFMTLKLLTHFSLKELNREMYWANSCPIPYGGGLGKKEICPVKMGESKATAHICWQ